MTKRAKGHFVYSQNLLGVPRDSSGNPLHKNKKQQSNYSPNSKKTKKMIKGV